MKTGILILAIGALEITCHGQMVEPYGTMAEPATVIFNEDKAILEQRIIQNLGRLQGVETDAKTGEPIFEKSAYHPDWPKEWPLYSSLATNIAQMEMDSIRVWWQPPKPASQKISQGGRDIKPVRSEIWIVVGCLRSNRQASVVRLCREWTYNLRAHIRYTEIPLWRMDQSRDGSYASDHKWLRQLAPGKDYPVEYSCAEYDSRILQVLRTLPPRNSAAGTFSGATRDVPDKSL